MYYSQTCNVASCQPTTLVQKQTRAPSQYKDGLSRYEDSYVKDKTV